VGRFLSILLLAVMIPASLAARSQASATSGAAQAPGSGTGKKPSGSAKESDEDKKLREKKKKLLDKLDKEELTPAQRKLDSHLRYEIEVQGGKPRRAVRTGLAPVTVDGDGRALVEIRARILTQLGRKIERMKGTVVSASPEYRSMIAWVPLLKLEPLAAESIVSAIAPAPKSITVRPQHR
jgi:hypothetical protein